ncbi:MAG: methyltransferase domain-containing protein [Parcubacteria group bacterium]|nr:methyltransferase domain-containing protein [Parcubacteria group bacterium]
MEEKTLLKTKTDDPNSPFYESYWRHRGQSGYRPRHKIFAQWIADGSKVLDVGCGDCSLLRYLVASKRNIRPLGLDISETALNICRERKIPAQRHDAAKKLPFNDGEFDFTIISETLEHIPNPEELLLEARRVTKKAVLVSIPNIALWKHRLRLLILGRFPKQWILEPREHLRFFSVKDFEAATQKLGFKISQREVSSGTRLLKYFWPNLFADQVCFCLIWDS